MVIVCGVLTGLNKGAFYDCKKLKEITMPDGVKNIGDEAFSGCTSLKSITIPSSVISIGSRAFSSCYSLDSVEFKGSIEQWRSAVWKDGFVESKTERVTVTCSDGEIKGYFV